MMQFGFKDYNEFKGIFVREDGRRKNGVLLSFFKNKDVRKFARDMKQLRKFLNIKSMAELFAVCDEFVRNTARGGYTINILGKSYYNEKYLSDNFNGVCDDMDFTAYRYKNMERDGQVFKMKIGKMYKHLIQTSDFGKLLNEQIILFMCEEMARKWIAENASKYSKYHLHVDDDFEKIYSSDWLIDDFGSCMTDEYQHSFYEDAVDASAAYLTNDDGGIVARCVIFNKCTDQDGKVWRLAERQYSSGGDEVLKQMLVCALINGKHIDGYKKVGADCHNSRAFISVDGTPLTDRCFHIKCYLDKGDTLSYQDSFKWYDMDTYTAYNYNDCDDCCDMLDITDAKFCPNGRNYDEYHETYTRNDVLTVYYHGNRITCDCEDLEDFYYIDGARGYYHHSDVSTCEECSEMFMPDEGRSVYSDITEEWYCCSDCRESAEQEYKESNWEYSEYDDEYFESVETFYNLEGDVYVERTISPESLEDLGDNVVEVNGALYLKSDILDEWVKNNQ